MTNAQIIEQLQGDADRLEGIRTAVSSKTPAASLARAAYAEAAAILRDSAIVCQRPEESGPHLSAPLTVRP